MAGKHFTGGSAKMISSSSSSALKSSVPATPTRLFKQGVYAINKTNGLSSDFHSSTAQKSTLQFYKNNNNNNNNNNILKNDSFSTNNLQRRFPAQKKNSFHSKTLHRNDYTRVSPSTTQNAKTNSLFLSQPNNSTTNHLKAKNPSQIRSFADYPPHQAEPLPALSPTMETGILDQWLKKEGDHIKPGDAIASVQTDKATIDWQVTDEGYLAKILVPEGTEDIPVGGPPLCIIVEDKESIAAFKDYKPEASSSSSSSSSPPPPAQESSATPKKAEAPTQQAAQTSSPAPTSSTDAAPVVAGAPPPASEIRPSRILASPLAKSLAGQLGIDLGTVSGSGPQGRIVAADLSKGSAATTSSAKTATPQPSSSGGVSFTDIQNSNIRKTTARRLTESKQTIPHYYLTVECQVDQLLKTRSYLNGKANGKYKISVNDFVLKAASLALKDVPECNSHWMDSFIRQYHNIDINVAVNTDKGLFIPVVRNVDQLGLAQISEGVKIGADKARNGTITPQEMEGTFTISNLGMFGITSFSAVINPPQSCILAVGSSINRVVEDGNGGYKNASFMNVTLSCDHRVVDGAIGARWLQSFKDYIEDPLKMLV